MIKYQSYKPSGVEWIGEIPEGWKISKYKYNLNILSGFPFKSELFDNENGFPLLRIRDITSGTIETYYNGDFDNKYIIKKGDIVIGMDGDFNIREWDNDDILLNQRCCKIQEYNNLLLKFIYYTLPIDLTIINDLTYYTTVKHLSVDDLYNINCVLPPLQEQLQIVQFLDGKTELIDKLISTKERKINLLKEQRISLINQVVTKGLNPNVKMKDSGVEWIGEIPEHWIILRIKYVTQIFRGKFTHRPRNDERFYDGEYPFIQTGDIVSSGKYLTKYTQTLNELGFSVSKEFPIGTLVMTISGNIGDVSILKIRSCFPDSILGFFPMSSTNEDYLYYLFTSLKQEFLKNSTVSTQMNLNVERVGSIQVPLPKMNEQIKIVDYLDTKIKEIDELVDLEQRKIDLLKEYRQSLISEVVTGKIKVTTDE